MITFLETIEEAPRGGGGTQSGIFCPFSRHHAHIFPVFTQSYILFTFPIFTLSPTHYFRFHAITQGRKANKMTFMPSRTAKKTYTHRVTLSSLDEINFTNWRSTQKIGRTVRGLFLLQSTLQRRFQSEVNALHLNERFLFQKFLCV